MLSRIQFTLYIRITYNKKCFLIALVFQNTFFGLGFLALRPQKPAFIVKNFMTIESIWQLKLNGF